MLLPAMKTARRVMCGSPSLTKFRLEVGVRTFLSLFQKFISQNSVFNPFMTEEVSKETFKTTTEYKTLQLCNFLTIHSPTTPRTLLLQDNYAYWY